MESRLFIEIEKTVLRNTLSKDPQEGKFDFFLFSSYINLNF